MYRSLAEHTGLALVRTARRAGYSLAFAMESTRLRTAMTRVRRLGSVGDYRRILSLSIPAFPWPVWDSC
eukprot:626636-Amorphochlora_amoeboformis.AAC.2